MTRRPLMTKPTRVLLAASIGLASAAAVAASTATASADDDGVAVSQWLEASLE